MAHITVEYLTLFRDVTGKRDEVVEIADATLGSLLAALDQRYGARWKGLLWTQPQKALSPYIMIIVNGILERDLTAPLPDGSTVALTPAVSGG
jgi:MoaD family protein